MLRTRAICCTIRRCVARTSLLRRMSTPSTCEGHAREGVSGNTGVGLRRMLMGLPLSQRSAAADALERRDLDRHLAAVSALMPELYGESEACRQARMELNLVVELEGEGSLECKRAALLFALAREKEMELHLTQAAKAAGAEADARLVGDLRERVLPFVFPRFLRNLCQTPDAMVALSCVLAEMWAGEPLGNYGHGGVEGSAAHHQPAEAVL